MKYCSKLTTWISMRTVWFWVVLVFWVFFGAHGLPGKALLARRGSVLVRKSDLSLYLQGLLQDLGEKPSLNYRFLCPFCAACMLGVAWALLRLEGGVLVGLVLFF